jgi:hypothetical protein
LRLNPLTAGWVLPVAVASLLAPLSIKG